MDFAVLFARIEYVLQCLSFVRVLLVVFKSTLSGRDIVLSEQLELLHFALTLFIPSFILTTYVAALRDNVRRALNVCSRICFCIFSEYRS